MINAGEIEEAGLAEKIKQEVRKSFKLDGVLVDDPQVIENIAGEFEGNSNIVPLRRNKEGLIVGSGKDKLLTSEEFQELQSAVDTKISELCGELICGSTQVAPKKTGQETACRYCMYKSICHFDLSLEGCIYKVVK